MDDVDGIEPDRLADALRVLAEVEQLPTEHPDAVAIRRAVGGLFKTVKKQRRRDRQSEVRANDDAVTAATATGAPGRIDDETNGVPLRPSGARRHADQGARVLRLQGALPRGRRLLPPALSRLRGVQPRAPRRPDGPHAAAARC